LTQQELARRVGCSVSLIFKIESDERRPSRQVAELLARHLEIPTEQQELFLKVARQQQATDALSSLAPAASSPVPPFPIPERIAGMTANLGLVAKARGHSDLAREQLQKALKFVEPVGNHHLEVRTRIWLAPMLAKAEARACLNAARALARQDGLKGLLEEIERLEKNWCSDLTPVLTPA
jgi:transcriptional regulator with XRE-family HTH domain